MSSTRPVALTPRERMIAALAWDAAIASLRHEDGTPVEIVSNTNPYRDEAPTDV